MWATFLPVCAVNTNHTRAGSSNGFTGAIRLRYHEMETIRKQSYETFTIAGDFVDQAESGELAVLAGSVVLAVDKEGVDVGDTLLDQTTKEVDGTQLRIRLRAGSEAVSPYKVTFKTVTTLDNKWEIDVSCRLKGV